MEIGNVYVDKLTCFTLWVLLCLENRTTLVSPGNEGLSGKMDFLNSQVVHSGCLGCMCVGWKVGWGWM